MKTKFVKIIGLLLIACFLFFPDLAIAQDDPFGVNNLNIVLEQDIDPKSAIVNIINIVLGFLGLIAVIIIIYGGFVWMMSGGESEKIDKAKKILKNGLIGLVIILLSWGIATYIFSKIIEIGGGGGTGSITPGTSFNLGYGALGNCTLESVYPAPSQKEVARNTIIMMTFKEELDPLSVCVDAADNPCACGVAPCNLINTDNFEIYPTLEPANKLTNAVASITADNKTIVITPQEYLGSASGKMDYTVKISGIKKADGDLMFKTCANDVYFEWSFEVSDKLDLEPPIIVNSGVFPPTDNSKDFKDIIESVAATGSIKVLSCPNIYKQAKIVSYSTLTGSHDIESIEVNPNYSQNFNNLYVYITSDELQAQLRDAQNNLLGSAVINNNVINFPNYFSLEVGDHVDGDSWEIEINSRILADNLVVGSQTYVFGDNSNANMIEVPLLCNKVTVATNIYNKLLAHLDLDSITVNNDLISFKAKVAGSSGNNIFFNSTSNNAFEFVPMSGGADQTVSYTINDKADQPMNSVIQINFNEAINPMTAVGPANLVSDDIRVFNKGGAIAGAACSLNSDCESYNCDSAFCVGDYLSGEFRISNAYKTLEFVSDWECGVNGCGGKVFCLPAESNLEVEIMAPDLFECTIDADCSTKQPFSTCQLDTDLAYETCQNGDSNNYPLADINLINGIVDTALNSFDGNRNNYSDGPVSFFNQNNPNINGDNYKWSFWINDVINLEPPVIESVSPEQGKDDATRDEIIKVQFDSLMQSSTLRTGSVLSNGIRHQYVNLKSFSGAVGYWISSLNHDTDNDGMLDKTYAYINHTNLPPSVTWRSQVGSGVRNIYQNCFKPSKGPGCNTTEDNPSCCFGAITDTLTDGNCP